MVDGEAVPGADLPVAGEVADGNDGSGGTVAVTAEGKEGGAGGGLDLDAFPGLPDRAGRGGEPFFQMGTGDVSDLG